MSNPYSTVPAPASDDFPMPDMDRPLIDHVHEAQVNLKILAGMLASSASPELSKDLIWIFFAFHDCLQRFTPSHSRH